MKKHSKEEIIEIINNSKYIPEKNKNKIVSLINEEDFLNKELFEELLKIFTRVSATEILKEIFK